MDKKASHFLIMENICKEESNSFYKVLYSKIPYTGNFYSGRISQSEIDRIKRINRSFMTKIEESEIQEQSISILVYYGKEPYEYNIFPIEKKGDTYHIMTDTLLSKNVDDIRVN